MNNLEDEELNFLMKEFETAWVHLGLLDSRRYHIFQYYSVFIGVTLGAVITSVELLSNKTILLYTALTCIFLLISFTSLTLISVIKSERKAVERYRDKINIIRRVFLENCENSHIKKILSKKGVGAAFEIKKCKKNSLSFCNLFIKKFHCTALFIKIYIQVIGFIATTGVLYSVYKILEIYCSKKI